MTNATLRIQQQPCRENPSQHFALIGAVDVHASGVLETLYILPSKATAELNFAQVERINSMGLAQLLKLFEHWQNREITIRVTHVNRMITVLFKMTGLSRFLSEAQEIQPAAPVGKIAQPEAAPAAVAATALQIQPPPSNLALAQHFHLTGIIDVDAVQILETLYCLPPRCAVELNFAQVQRVNSMGLAQLLKLFEHWQKRHVSIRISNANRMIGVLFKMTGLARFLSDAPQTQEAPPVKPMQVNTRAETAKRPAVTTGSDKLKLWVNAQSSQQMNGWYFFNTYLQRHLGREIHLELIHGAMGEHHKKIEDMDIVFTKPFEATRLILEHQFLPLSRPLDQADEVTLLVRADDPRQTLAAFQGGKIVTAAPDNFVYLLGRFLLEEDEAALSGMEYLFSGHDIKALQMLLKGAADILFVLSDTYRGLSGLTRKNLREIDQSDTTFAFHLFSVAPHCRELGEALSEVLLNMGMDSQGRQVLADLGIPGWIKPTPDECDMLAMLFNRYATGNTSP
jgi:ABC-type transporter Mla MlaB component